MKSVRRLVPLLFLLFCAAQAQTALESLYDSLRAVRGIQAVELAPDGSRVAWVEQDSEIYAADLKTSKTRRVASGHGIAWAPDSRRLAFLSDTVRQGQPQLYVVDEARGTPKKLTELTGDMARPRWSPDGRTIAFLFAEDARAAGPLAAAAPQTGVIGGKIVNQRLAAVEVASGQVRQVSPPELHVYEYDWSPDGRRFAATAAPGPGDDNWYVASLYTLDAAGGPMTAIHKPELQIADPRWSPDGSSIAFIGGLMSDEGATGGDVWVAPAAGGQARNVTPGLAASASSLRWVAAGRILVGELIDGDSGFASVDPATGSVEQLWRGGAAVSINGWLPGLSVSRDGALSGMTRHSFEEPPEVWVGKIGAWRRVSQTNVNRPRGWGEARSIHWRSEGRPVQGWLVYPRGYDPKQRWPLVVWVHGGPAGMEISHWPAASLIGMLAADGYFVLLPNPRGSFGSDEAFTEANRRDFGYGDFRDILAGVDEVVRTLPVDNDRVGISGWSYGGYMTMWAVTQTRRFAAAVAGAGLANWQSYYGENLIDQWMIPYFGASVYDDPAVYARSSPITFIKNAKTPTLVLVGERDAECPAPQSFEFWHALKTLGVPTDLVVYPNEGHGIANPEHQRDIVMRALGWFDERLKAAR